MSRIRSIHPGLWTDEDFVSLSAFARLLFMGIWNECDDKGIFQWSPLKMKMRVLPADNVDADELLQEIVVAGLARKYEHGSKSYGAVKNFAKFQRPKKPNDIHPASAEVLEYAGHSKPESETDKEEVENHLPTPSEKSPQREDGGGRMEDIEPKGSCASGDALTPDEVVEDWNELAGRYDLPKVRKLTDSRRRRLNARLRQYPEIEDWQRAFSQIAENKWMHGDNQTGWRADFDFLLQDKSFTKLTEGAYGKAD